MDWIDKLFASAIVVLTLAGVAFWATVAYVGYRVLTHYGIL